jgi:hypothetical protein
MNDETISNIQNECNAMLKHLCSLGKLDKDSIREYSNFLTSEASKEELITLHIKLSERAYPANPKTILLLAKEENSKLRFMGAVPIIRVMVFFTMIFLASFFIISSSEDVNGEMQKFDLFNNAGKSLILHEMFLVCSAGLGACFTNLFKLNKYVCKGTYNSVYDSSYYIDLILGVVAGTILAMLIPLEFLDLKDGSNMEGLSKPLLALLGGFSTSIVYIILERFRLTFETLIAGIRIK